MIGLRPYTLWIFACLTACDGTTPTQGPAVPEGEGPAATDKAQDADGSQVAPEGKAARGGDDDAEGMGVPPGIDTGGGAKRDVPPGIQCEPTEFVAGAACFGDATAACESLKCQQGCVTLETAPAQVRCK